MVDIDNLVRANIKSLAPYSSARDEFSGSEGVFLDANENPYGNLNRYPDPYQVQLKKAIGKLKKIPVENIFLGNGSDEIIDLLFRIFCIPGKDKALTFSPTYGMYEVSASVNDVEMIKIALNDDFQINRDSVAELVKLEKIKLIFICSPNNPTGNAFIRSDIEFILANFKGIVVIDEAYIDFCEKPSFLNHLENYPNLAIMQTFSKAWGMAGVRVGMAFSNAKIISYLGKIKPPYNISSINQKTVLDKIAEVEKFNSELSKILDERARIIVLLNQVGIVKHIYPTDANFLLVKVIDADLTYKKLVDQKIIVRNRTKVVKNCIRITVGTREENDKLLEVLSKM
jgi:histidinol-phosphate aminotransferase